MVIQLLFIGLLNFSACNPSSDSTKTVQPQYASDSVAIYQAKIDSTTRFIGKLDSLKISKKITADEKRDLGIQIGKNKKFIAYLKDKKEQFLKQEQAPKKEVAKQKDTIPATITPPTTTVVTHKPEEPFVPLFLKEEAGSKHVTLNENHVNYLVFVVDLEKYKVLINWADTGKSKKVYSNFATLQNKVFKAEKAKVKMMMNGGIFKVAHEPTSQNEPLGLYYENGKEICPLNTEYPNSDNFYLKPNGVFYWNGENAGIATTQDFADTRDKLKFSNAVQSGPMLLVNGKYHPAFKKGSSNLNIRNGVGVSKDGKKIVFAISEEGTNFYDFATLFKHFGCHNALYLDGAISRVFMPEKGRKDLNGNFASIITVLEK